MDRVTMLNAYIEEVKATKFKPGRFDCAIFAAGWVERLTGKDLAARWQWQYKSLKAGKQLLREAGIASHIDLAASEFDEVPPALAQIGDIAVLEDEAFGIVAGETIYALRPDGVAIAHLTSAQRAFRV